MVLWPVDGLLPYLRPTIRLSDEYAKIVVAREHNLISCIVLKAKRYAVTGVEPAKLPQCEQPNLVVYIRPVRDNGRRCRGGTLPGTRGQCPTDQTQTHERPFHLNILDMTDPTQGERSTFINPIACDAGVSFVRHVPLPQVYAWTSMVAGSTKEKAPGTGA